MSFLPSVNLSDPHGFSACGGYKRVSDLLEEELQATVLTSVNPAAL